MPSYRWSCLIAALCGVGSASWGTAASAYQYPPLSDDINTRFFHRPDAWVGGGFQSSGPINQSPAEFGPAPGMQQRSSNGSPASGDSFPFMSPGPLPGGRSPDGFNGSGMRPPVNQPASITNNPLFGGNGQSPSSQSPFGQNPAGQNVSGQTPFGSATQMTDATRMKPKVSWAFESAQQPYVGLLGQIARPGVYEIERRGTMLADLLQDIGGLAKDASGQFRVIRNGCPGQTTSYSGAAQFELMAGDLIIADAQPSQVGQRTTNVKATSDDAVQIGFVNLVDRPVVLKLRNEHATVFEILTTMEQDQGLASQIKIVTPSSQRFQGQPRPDTKLVSETVLIFPQNSVKKSAILESLPEPFKLKREADASAQPSNTAQSYAPRGNLSPDVTQSPRSQPSVEAWSNSTPLPETAQPVSRPSVEPSPEDAEVPPPPAEDIAASKRASGVRGTPHRTATAPDRIARDSNLLHAPPTEGSIPTPRDVPSNDVAQDNAPAPEFNVSTPFDDNRNGEPSLLNAKGKKRPIQLAKDDASNDATLTAADLDEVEASADKASSSWSIWLPILTAGVGLLALIGFRLSLRRRTPTTAQASQVVTTQPVLSTIRNPQSVPRRELLDEIIDDQLPLTEERVPFASPMQFHGRPQPPKTIRMDQRHSLPRPHSVKVPSSEFRAPSQKDSRQTSHTETPQASAASRAATTATQKIRIDRTGATGTGAKIVSSPAAQSSSRQPTSGPLDRALSALQKREERGA